MTLAFLDLSPDERKLHIDEAAARRGLSPVIIEKDFWVCWLLGLLFESSFRDAIVFKGGTSLSKVFEVINRFSEDIDLSLAPAFLGLDEPEAVALKRSVKLEFGSLTDQRPTAGHAVRPWIADVLPDAFADWHCEVVALDLYRAFWEKATILHAEHHRPADKPTPDRFARHYADTAALALHADASGAIIQSELRDRVVHWKSRFFGSAWARYDLARPPTFKLVPPPEREAALRRDYEAMREMYISEPQSFERILSTLADVERQVNEGRSQAKAPSDE